MRVAWVWGAAHAQPQDGAVKKLPPVTVTATATRGAVEKSYRKMIAGMDLFDRMRHTNQLMARAGSTTKD